MSINSDLRIDQHSATLVYQTVKSDAFLAEKKVVVIVSAWGGYGDASCAYKILKYLLERVGISRENLVWINSVKEYGEFFDPQQQFKAKYCRTAYVIFDPWKNSYDGPNRELIELVDELYKENFSPDLFLLGPAPTAMPPKLKELAKFNVPILPFVEYGCGFDDYGNKPISYPRHIILGIRPEHMGIHIDEKLFKWSQSTPTKLEKLRELKNIPEKIQVAILGKPFSEDAIKEFHAQWQLFFGYGSGTSAVKDKQAMVLTIAKMAYQYEKSDSNLCLFFLGSSFKELSESDLEELKRLGVKKISWAKEQVEVVLAEKGKEIKIINYSLKPHQIPMLLMASENESLTTGDQFFSECTSAQKHFIYQALMHKSGLLNDLTNKAHETDEEFGKLFHDVYLRTDNSSFSIDGAAKLLFRGRVDKKMAIAWKTFTTNLCQDCAFGPKFKSHIQALLITQECLKDVLKDEKIATTVLDFLCLTD